jgi:hypothetical protein
MFRGGRKIVSRPEEISFWMLNNGEPLAAVERFSVPSQP